MNDDAPKKSGFKGPGDPREIGKLGGRPRGSKNKEKPDPLANLPIKKQKYALYRAQGKSMREAALRSGHSIHIANQASVKIETQDYRAAFQELMRQKIPMNKIAKTIRQGMSAVDTKFVTQDGKFTDHRDVINWPERRKAAQLAAEMSGAFIPKSELNVNQQVDEGTLKRMADISDRLFAHVPADKLKELEASHVPLTIEADISDY
jgi:hypothetical protein